MRDNSAYDPARNMEKLRRPTAAELEAARGGALRDVIAPGLRVLFCGINPSLYSVATGHHFARPGNRFWPALHRGGFTDRLLSPAEDARLIDFGCGVTNLVHRATVAADEVTREEFLAGAASLARKLRKYRPTWVAFVGIGAYRTSFAKLKATVGRQDHTIGETGVWVLPNTSGLNANHQIDDLAKLFADLRAASG